MVKKKKYIPQRGDVIYISLNPQAGHEQAGRRPAVVISPLAYNNKVGLVILCPITNQIKGYPFEVIIPDGLIITGAILSDQIKSLDWQARKAKFICTLPVETIHEVLEKLSVLLLE
ncbi:MAG TPA: endoribonuclease MazF [bacterium]|nr:endoribonuclease MazF [bacterium]